MKLNKWLVALGVLIIIGFVFWLINQAGACRDFNEAKLFVNNVSFDISVADERPEQVRGLIGCKKVPDNKGMYFTYDKPEIVQYWMRGMSISIDIIWIRGGEVIGIEPSVPPAAATAVDAPRYKPEQPITAVLELGAGQAAAQGIKVGSTVDFQQ